MERRARREVGIVGWRWREVLTDQRVERGLHFCIEDCVITGSADRVTGDRPIGADGDGCRSREAMHNVARDVRGRMKADLKPSDEPCQIKASGARLQWIRF